MKSLGLSVTLLKDGEEEPAVMWSLHFILVTKKLTAIILAIWTLFTAALNRLPKLRT